MEEIKSIVLAKNVDEVRKNIPQIPLIGNFAVFVRIERAKRYCSIEKRSENGQYLFELLVIKCNGNKIQGSWKKCV